MKKHCTTNGRKHSDGRVAVMRETTRLGAIIMGRGKSHVPVISASKFHPSPFFEL